MSFIVFFLIYIYAKILHMIICVAVPSFGSDNTCYCWKTVAHKFRLFRLFLFHLLFHFTTLLWFSCSENMFWSVGNLTYWVPQWEQQRKQHSSHRGVTDSSLSLIDWTVVSTLSGKCCVQLWEDVPWERQDRGVS